MNDYCNFSMKYSKEHSKMFTNLQIIIVIASVVILLCSCKKYPSQSLELFLNENDPKYHNCNTIVHMMRDDDRTKKFNRLSKNTKTILNIVKPDIQEILRKDGTIDRSIQSRCIIPHSQMERFKLMQVVNPVNEEMMCKTNVAPDMGLREVTFPYEANRGCIIDLKRYTPSTLESDMGTLYKIDKLAYKEVNDNLQSSYKFVNTARNASVDIYNNLSNRVLPKAKGEENSWKAKNIELNKEYNALLNENRTLSKSITQREMRRILEPELYKSRPHLVKNQLPSNVANKKQKDNAASKFVSNVGKKVSKLGNKLLSKLKNKR